MINNKVERWIPLHYAIFGEAFEATKYLLDNGADPNKRCSKGNSSYHYAIINGNVKFLELLEEKGGDARYKSEVGTNGMMLINELLKNRDFQKTSLVET